MLDSISGTNSMSTETGLAPSLPTTKAQATPTGAPPTSPRSLTPSLHQRLKNNEITPEEAVAEAFPSPFVRVHDIDVGELKVTPLETGFRTLDRHFVLKQGRPELVVVGAGTSHGKSAFMLQVAAHVSKQGPVLVFSLEMDERDIKARLLAPRINVGLQHIMGGKVEPKKLRAADEEFKKMQLMLCTNGRRDVHYMQQATYDFSRSVGEPHLIVCDYLQLMRGPTKNTRTAEIAEILGILKEMAKAHKCPVLIGSQLNRECERRGKAIQQAKGVGDYTPIKSDLMDSGSIEHDADVIMFISRQYVYDRTREGEADFYIAKNRAGKLYSGVFGFTGELCTFVEPSEGPL